MDKNRKAVLDMQIKRTMQALEKNGMKAQFAETKEDAVRAVENLLSVGDTISCGGTMSLPEGGVTDLMNSGKYTFLDRDAGVYTRDEVYKMTFSADAFITGTNAVTESGELYNVDGYGNRLAAICYGPKKVIVVAGCNKIVKDMSEAIYRMKTVTVPANGLRLNLETPCTKTGRCAKIDGGVTSGCNSDNRLCCQYLVTGYQHVERIYVVIVGEELGY